MPHHAHATMRALELVVAVVDATTAMEVVETLRHAPELLHALGGAVAPHCYYTFWDSAHGDRRGLRIAR